MERKEIKNLRNEVRMMLERKKKIRKREKDVLEDIKE